MLPPIALRVGGVSPDALHGVVEVQGGVSKRTPFPWLDRVLQITNRASSCRTDPLLLYCGFVEAVAWYHRYLGRFFDSGMQKACLTGRRKCTPGGTDADTHRELRSAWWTRMSEQSTEQRGALLPYKLAESEAPERYI